jgi:hypothetical protein
MVCIPKVRSLLILYFIRPLCRWPFKIHPFYIMLVQCDNKAPAYKQRQGKVKLSLFFIKHHSMKMHWLVEIELYALLILILYGFEQSDSRPVRVIPEKISL